MVKAAKTGMWIKADGTIIPVVPKKGMKFTLEEVQKMVGGYVERVQLPGGNVALANEEGIPLGLPYNEKASLEAGINPVGDVLFVPRGMGW